MRRAESASEAAASRGAAAARLGGKPGGGLPELAEQALRELGSDARHPSEELAVARRDRACKLGRRERGEDAKRHLGAHPLDGGQEAEPGAFGSVGKTVEEDRVLAELGFDQEVGGRRRGGKSGERARRGVHEIADAADIDDAAPLFQRRHLAREARDHAPARSGKPAARAQIARLER